MKDIKPCLCIITKYRQLRTIIHSVASVCNNLARHREPCLRANQEQTCDLFKITTEISNADVIVKPYCSFCCTWMTCKTGMYA